MRCASFLSIVALASVASAASRYEKRKNVDRPDPANLDHCPGHATGDADTCTFESQSAGPDAVVEHIVGDPVDNCTPDPSNPQNITSSVGGSTTVSQSWKYGISEGFSADGGEELPIGVSFENSDTWTSTDAKTFTQTLMLTIEPNMKVRLLFCFYN